MNGKEINTYAYKLAIKKQQKTAKEGITDSLLATFSNKSKEEFWKTWRSKMGRPKVLPQNVYGKTNEQDIAQCFANSIKDACSNNLEEVNNKLYLEYRRMLDEYKSKELHEDVVYEVPVELVDNSIAKLTKGKTAGLDLLTVEHFKHCHPIIVLIITKLFNLMLSAHYVPNSFGNDLIVPIPKGGSSNSKNSTEDYRGISITLSFGIFLKIVC